MARSTELGAALAAGVRARREALGRTQDDLASAGRALGFPWTAAIVAAMETRKREIHLEELVALLSILDAPLPAILPDETFTLSESAVVSGRSLVWGLGGEIAPVVTRQGGPTFMQWFADRYVKPYWPNVSQKQVEAIVEAAHADAECHASERLGIDAYAVATLAFKAWGRSLTEERDARVAEQAQEGTSPRTLQALRGHVTRGLLNDLRLEIVRRGKRAGRRK